MKLADSKIFLLLLESNREYEAYLKQQSTMETHELLICCLSVIAVDYCEKNNLQFILPENCFSDGDSEQYREISENKIKELVKRLNAYFHEEFGTIDGFRFDIGNYYYFMLYHFFGALHYRAFILWKIIETHYPHKILIGRSLHNTKQARLFPVSQYLNNYFDLCMHSIYCDKVIPLVLEPIIDKSYTPRKVKIRNFLSKTIRKFKISRELLYAYRNNIPVSLFHTLFYKSKLEILLVGGVYNWVSVFRDPSLKNKIDIFADIDEMEISPNRDKNWFFEWFNWQDQFCGFDVALLGIHEMERVRFLANNLIGQHARVMNRIKQYKAIVYSVCPYFSQQYILSIGKHLGIPRICYQHGEMSLYYPGLWNEASELLYLSHYFSFGEQVSIAKSNNANHTPGFCNVINIGSTTIDALRIKSNDRADYILYASSKYLNNAGGFIPRYCDNNVKNCQSLLIKYFEMQIRMKPNLSVIWKQNQERLVVQPIEMISGVKIIRDEKKFIDLLPNARAIILDRPSTTVIEACLTSKPIFVLLANKNWYPFPEALLRKRVVVTYTPEELLHSIDRFLNDGYYPADLTNREFLRAYGVHHDDGKSTQRAVDALFNLMGQTCV